MKVSQAVGLALAQWGVDRVFGVAGSGNFEVTAALVAGGATYVAARHENGATTMADGYARLARRTAVASVHQGPGLTNAMTGIAEAVKAHTPLLVVAGAVPGTMRTSNFWIDQAAAVEALGAVALRLESPQTALADAARAVPDRPHRAHRRARTAAGCSGGADRVDRLRRRPAGAAHSPGPVGRGRRRTWPHG